MALVWAAVIGFSVGFVSALFAGVFFVQLLKNVMAVGDGPKRS